MGTETKPSLTSFINHARRYGDDEVLRAAFDSGLGLPQLVRLQEALDKLSLSQKYAQKPKYRLTVEERVRRSLGLTEGGNPDPEAA